MSRARSSSNKAKIARRVIEVLEFFDDENPEATVMDIVRRYNRPQSSTSELLSSLVELGILNKDAHSRAYSLTPRAAMLGTAGQPEMVRDGRLVRLLDRIVAQTGLTTALFGMVGLEVQVISWRKGAREKAIGSEQLSGGRKQALTELATGWLLLSTRERPRREGLVRRLNAEADERSKFSYSEMLARIEDCGHRGTVVGPAGFGTDAQIACALVPGQPDDQPLAIGIVHRANGKVQPENLLQCIEDAMRQCLATEEPADNVQRFPTAA